jgi:hypothetical protein
MQKEMKFHDVEKQIKQLLLDGIYPPDETRAAGDKARYL